MILDLNALPRAEGEPGYPFEGSLDLSDVRLWGGAPLREPVQVSGRLSERAGILSLDLDIRYRLAGECGRCLAPVRRDGRLSVRHVVVDRLPRQDPEGEYVQAPGGRLDLDAVAREDLIPELPMELLCGEDCAGLCPKCGKDLNEGPCPCGGWEPGR